MCSIEYTPSEVTNGLEAFDLGAVAAATAANAATAQVFIFNIIYEYYLFFYDWPPFNAQIRSILYSFI